MKTHIHESHFIDQSDDQLKESLGYLHEGLKNLKEQMKTDPEIERMTTELKAYKDDNFNVQIKDFTRLLKAARTIAKMRGIVWRAPDDIK